LVVRHQLLLGFLGLIAVIMIIYGGFTYVTAAGKQEAVDSAKKTILYAIVGIVIILLSFAIVNTVLGVASDGGGAAPAAATTPVAAPAQ
jgi:TRAP-type C4-dicarboxylate transport system permease small subunit